MAFNFFQLFNFTHHLGCLLHGFLVLACLKAFTPARVTLPLVNSETEKTSPWSVGGVAGVALGQKKKSPKQKEEEATETFAWICFFGDFSRSTIVNHY